MKATLTFVVGCFLLAAVCISGQERRSDAGSKFETRCGWFSNPTPANAWLRDREGEWIIGAQGGFQAEGDWPNFKPRQWVKQNGDYGYGCACLNVRVNSETHQISQIKSSRALALSKCHRDPALKKWGRL